MCGLESRTHVGRIGSPCEIWEVGSILVFDEFSVGGDGKLEIKYDFFVFVLFLLDHLKSQTSSS